MLEVFNGSIAAARRPIVSADRKLKVILEIIVVVYKKLYMHHFSMLPIPSVILCRPIKSRLMRHVLIIHKIVFKSISGFIFLRYRCPRFFLRDHWWVGDSPIILSRLIYCILNRIQKVPFVMSRIILLQVLSL